MCVKACEMQHWCKETEKRSKRVRTTGRRRIETFEHFLFGDSHRNRFREKTMQQNRSPVSSDPSSFINLMPKRLKIDVTLSSKEKKEKFSERISALQQLVSPFGKTDTASVLLEAMDYINFLHEQVKVLGAPYLYSTPTETEGGEEPCSLKAKSLCLVPVSLTVGVVSSNGADIWAPIKTTTQNSKRLVWDEEASVVTHS